MLNRAFRCALALSVVCVVGPLTAALGHPMDRYNVVWTTPSKDSTGTMPLGNGDIGLNLWVEEDGDLLILLSKTDAWDESARLLKLGRLRVKLSPNPFRAGLPFHQELRLRQGEVRIQAGRPGARVDLAVWVDANRPVVRVEGRGQRPLMAQALLEVWRTRRRTLTGGEEGGSDSFAADQPPFVTPDVVMDGGPGRVVWYHRNSASLWPVTLKHQGLESLITQQTDPLLNRTFGGALRGEGMLKESETSLRTNGSTRRLSLAIYPLTAQTATAAEWAGLLTRSMEAVDTVSPETARREHRRWWADFWDRSWVRVTGSRRSGLAAEPMVRNTLPLRLGADSDGGNRFVGEIARAAVYNRALTAEEIRQRARSTPGSGPPAGCVGEWDLGALSGGACPNRVPGGAAARVVGSVDLVDVPGAPGGRAGRFGGGYLEVPHAPALDLSEAVTLEAWVRPGALPPGGGRILDKTRAGTSDGYLLDTYPGNSLRLIVADGTLTHDARLPAGAWTHVAAVFDARTGEKRLYLNGADVASGAAQPEARPEHEVVSQGYALQRFINACAGRGAFPIKFNGSLFTVDVIGKYDPDFRQWGGCYWFQNTRLPYWPMLASGDHDLMRPLFEMYRRALPLAEARTRLYFGHDGAFFPETMHFWGAYHNGGFGYGWDREGDPLWRTDNEYIRTYWSGALELTALMLDHYAYTRDQRFLQDTLLPLARSILRFYDRHYPRDADGRIRFEPSQSLETYWGCVNPLPEVAGLRFVLRGLLELPEEAVGAGAREEWSRLQAELPPLPLRRVAGETLLSPAQVIGSQHNVENPELYAVFPYRLYGVGKPDLELARRTFAARQFRGNWGWQQDDTQMAFLGLAEEARKAVAGRFANKHKESRFPAFWGPNFDWIPDQDHGANGLMALQTMLLQAEGRKILLLPAWPREWDAEFRLHAPYRTTVEGVVREGKLLRLKVTPASRARDVVVVDELRGGAEGEPG